MLNVARLIQAYSNEKSTKKLLKYDQIVDEFNLEISTNQIVTGNDNLVETIKEVEMERLKYFVKEYVLIRLDKMRSNFFLDVNLMNHSEREFYEKYIEIARKNTIYEDEPSKDIEIVGFMANKKLESVRIDGEIIEIYKGDFFVGSFDDIEEHLNENSVRLI
jgi:GINS complex subunit 4